MGCCLCTPKQHQNGLKNQQAQLRSHAPKSPNATHESECRVPPPPLPPAEESVKEVLLETPISKPQVPILTPESKTQLPIVLHRDDPIDEKAALLEEASDDFSPVSETCSVGESFSTTTTVTVTESREDEVTSKRGTRGGTQNRNRSHYDASRRRSHAVIRNGIGGRERPPNSPARVTEPPPAKKVLMGSGSVRRRESGQFRRDPGGSSGRRPGSPSCERTVGAGACRRHLRPPGGASRRLPPMENGEVVGEKNGSVLMEESLENPHVSLECFIFL